MASKRPRLSDRQRQWLVDVAAGVDPMSRFHGRSEHGGAVQIPFSLRRHGLLDDSGGLTYSGTITLAYLQRTRRKEK